MIAKYQPFKEFFVSFYKGEQHIITYRLVKDKSEVYAYIRKHFGRVSDLVIDQVL